MLIKKLPAGTRMYLTKKLPHELYIQPGTTLVNDSLYVKYDVRIDGQTVIPKGTRVVGDWVTETNPSIAAQLQVTKVYLSGSGQLMAADSDVIEATTLYNSREIDNACHLYKQNHYHAKSGIDRRIVNFHCRVMTLPDNRTKSIYLEIFTEEIPVTFTADFIPFPFLQ